MKIQKSISRNTSKNQPYNLKFHSGIKPNNYITYKPEWTNKVTPTSEPKSLKRKSSERMDEDTSNEISTSPKKRKIIQCSQRPPTLFISLPPIRETPRQLETPEHSPISVSQFLDMI